MSDFTPSRRHLIVAGTVLAALVVSGAVFFFPGYSTGCKKNGSVLEIRDSDSGKVYGEWFLKEAGEFSVEFIHSVHQSPVRESFILNGRTIKPVAVRFYSFGAGMQSDLEEGQVMSRDGDAVVLSGFSTSYRELNYIVGTVSDHLFFINDNVYSLRELCGRNAHIKIRAR